MREIKFRAWDKELKRMRAVRGIHHFATPALEVLVGNGDEVTVSLAWNEVELMQYTGLKDKNGKEIYEGDVVNFKHKGKEYT